MQANTCMSSMPYQVPAVAIAQVGKWRPPVPGGCVRGNGDEMWVYPLAAIASAIAVVPDARTCAQTPPALHGFPHAQGVAITARAAWQTQRRDLPAAVRRGRCTLNH
jgi:hypothetical protein